jgi:hypothetical protein
MEAQATANRRSDAPGCRAVRPLFENLKIVRAPDHAFHSFSLCKIMCVYHQNPHSFAKKQASRALRAIHFHCKRKFFWRRK